MKQKHQNNLSFILWLVAYLVWLGGLTVADYNIGYYFLGLICVLMTFVQSLDVERLSSKDSFYE